MASKVLKKIDNELIDKVIEKNQSNVTELIQILLQIQQESGLNYLTEASAQRVAEKLNIPVSRVFSVVSFYDALSLKEKGKYTINVCNGTACSIMGSSTVTLKLKELLNISFDETTEDGIFTLRKAACFGACDIAPAIRINDYIYGNLTDEKLQLIIENVKNDNLENELLSLLYKSDTTNSKSIITSNFGKINGSIDNYMSNNGFESLKKAYEIGHEKTAEEITKADIRGRGGAEYPTGKKLTQARESEGERKFVVCNADEGEPGTFKDRELLKNDPYKIIEGMIIASFVADSKEGIIYIREEYTWMHDSIRDAIKKSYEKGFLGENILNSGHSFDLRLFSGAGAYVCGEGFALCESLEGKTGMPRNKPPYVKQSGYLNYPTLIINVETLSAIASFLKFGHSIFSEIGNNESHGTKVISISGKVNKPGVYEIPFGMTFNEIIDNIAGGMLNDKKPGFLQSGGASGAIIPANLFNTEYAYRALKKIGASIGSGAIVVADEDDDIIDYIYTVQSFFAHESCGKCAPCREGNMHLNNLLKKFIIGNATKKDYDFYKRIVIALKDASLCGGGKTEAVPLLTSIRYFEQKFLERIMA